MTTKDKRAIASPYHFGPGEVIDERWVALTGECGTIVVAEDEERAWRLYFLTMDGHVLKEKASSFDEFKEFWGRFVRTVVVDLVESELPPMACANCSHYMQSTALRGVCGIDADIEETAPTHLCGNWKSRET